MRRLEHAKSVAAFDGKAFGPSPGQPNQIAKILSQQKTGDMRPMHPRMETSSFGAGSGGAIQIKVMGSQHFKYRMKSYEALSINMGVIAQPKVVERCTPQDRASQRRAQSRGTTAFTSAFPRSRLSTSQSNVRSIF